MVWMDRLRSDRVIVYRRTNCTVSYTTYSTIGVGAHVGGRGQCRQSDPKHT